MVLKQLRLSRHLSQEQLAEMSGLNVRTIQRIESGHNPSVESKKCIAAALNVDIETLDQEKVMIDKQTDHWKQQPLFIKLWFAFNFLQMRPQRATAVRVEIMTHITGFLFCLLGVYNEASLVGGLWMLSIAYLFMLLKWQGDKYGIWYDKE